MENDLNVAEVGANDDAATLQRPCSDLDTCGRAATVSRNPPRNGSIDSVGFSCNCPAGELAAHWRANGSSRASSVRLGLCSSRTDGVSIQAGSSGLPEALLALGCQGSSCRAEGRRCGALWALKRSSTAANRVGAKVQAGLGARTALGAGVGMGLEGFTLDYRTGARTVACEFGEGDR